VADTGWISVGQLVYVDTAGGGTGLSGALQVTAKTTTTVTLLNPPATPAIPLASATQQGLMALISGLSSDYIGGDNASHNLASAIQPVIWSVRLRSFNAVGNPNFEVDQRNVGMAVSNPVAGTFVVDRWFKGGSGTYGVTCQSTAQAIGGSNPILVPGTSFRPSSHTLQYTLTTAQTTLAAGDFLCIRQLVEGSVMRELINDVHSISLLVQSTVAPLTFSVALRDGPPITTSIVYPCTINTANVWQLITLPNIPLWASGGNWTMIPGVQGYDLIITLACGSTYIAPATGTWQNGSFLGASGMSNWCNNPINTTSFYLAFVQHEPGALCTTLIDKPFSQSLDECLRYFVASYDYGTKPGTASNSNGAPQMWTPANLHPYTPITFPHKLAKFPTTIIGYSPSTGASGNIRDWSSGIDRAISSTASAGMSGFNGFTLTTPNAAVANQAFHYTADTGL
jgi:hypothetical protein